MKDGFNVNGLDQQSIIDEVVKGTDIPAKPLAEYTKSQLVCLCVLLITLIQELLLSKLGVEVSGNIQEWLDEMTFKAKKDSRTSSLRPSSDMYGSRHVSPKDEPEEDTPHAESADGKDGSEEEAEAALRKDRNRSRRVKSGLKPGKQPGAKGFGFAPPDHVDEDNRVVIPPDKCKECPQWENCKEKATLSSAHNVYDFKIRIIRTSYQTAEVACPKTSEEETSSFPEEETGTNQYGLNIKTIIALLYTFGMVSLNRIKEIIGPVLGMKLSPATMLKFIRQLAERVKPAVEAILEAERKEKVVHCDETGAKVDGKLHWIHCVATELYTFVSIQEKRGKEGMDQIGFLMHYVGTVIHDCWSSYFKYENCDHATCNGHIERELAGLSKFFKDANKWADDMIKLLQNMLHTKHEAQRKNLKELPPEVINDFSTQFDMLIARGKELHSIPPKEPGKRGKGKRGRARALIDRMELRKEEIFRFLRDFDVPYTNNIAEASFRLIGVKRNVGIFRDLESAKNFCLIWSYLSTARKHGVSAYAAIHEAYLGNAMNTIFPKGEAGKKNDVEMPNDPSANKDKIEAA